MQLLEDEKEGDDKDIVRSWLAESLASGDISLVPSQVEDAFLALGQQYGDDRTLWMELTHRMSDSTLVVLVWHTAVNSFSYFIQSFLDTL